MRCALNIIRWQHTDGSNKGRKHKLETKSGRQRLNLHGAINIETLEMTVIESTAIMQTQLLSFSKY